MKVSSRNSFLSDEEIADLGFKRIGDDIKISRYARIYRAEAMEIGSHVRIDDFCLLSGNIAIGSFVHISAGAMLFSGESTIHLDDFSAVSGGARVYAVTEDLHSEYLANPTVPSELRRVKSKAVRIGKHGIVGALSTVLPGTVLAVGSVVGANSLLRGETEPWTIYTGIPAVRLTDRPRIDASLEERAWQADR